MAMWETDATLEADVGTAWRALSDSSLLATWFWPQRLAAEVTFTPVPGAAWRISSEVGEMAVGGVVVEAEAPVRLVLTWAWDGDELDDPSTVFVTLDGTSPTCTSLHLADDGLRDDQLADHEQGWLDCLARLVECPSVLHLAVEAFDGLDELLDHLVDDSCGRLGLVHRADDLADEVVGELLGARARAGGRRGRCADRLVDEDRLQRHAQRVGGVGSVPLGGPRRLAAGGPACRCATASAPCRSSARRGTSASPPGGSRPRRW